MGKTKIEWCDEVWNPTTGCTPVSSGCARCYAKRIYERFHSGQSFGVVRCHLERLDIPLNWKKPRRVFVDSMSDLFHEKVSFEFILRTWLTMARAKQHTFMILTKRIDRMSRFVNEWLPGAWGLAIMNLRLLDQPIPNIWLGVSVEHQRTADERIPLLLQTPAAKRFVSVEPMLDNIDLGIACWGEWKPRPPSAIMARQLPNPLNALDWVICGCESGPGARPMELDWARLLRDQCQAAGVPFFLKQMVVGGKIVKMPALDGKVWDEVPNVN